MNTPTVTNEPTEQSVVDLIRAAIPSGDGSSIWLYVSPTSVSWSACRCTAGLLHDNTKRADTLAGLIEAMRDWPSDKAARVKQLEAELAVPKGLDVEVPL